MESSIRSAGARAEDEATSGGPSRPAAHQPLPAQAANSTSGRQIAGSDQAAQRLKVSTAKADRLASGHAMQPQATPAAVAIALQESPSCSGLAGLAAAFVPWNVSGTGVSASAMPQSAPTHPQPVQAPQRLPHKRKAPAVTSAAATAPAQRKCEPSAAAGAAVTVPATPPQRSRAVHVALPSDMADFTHPPWMPKAGLLKIFGCDFFWRYTPQFVDRCPEGVDE